MSKLFLKTTMLLFKMFDVFVHVPIDAEIEAFGQIYIEALAVGGPLCVYAIRCFREFVKDGERYLLLIFITKSKYIMLLTEFQKMLTLEINWWKMAKNQQKKTSLYNYLQKNWIQFILFSRTIQQLCIFVMRFRIKTLKTVVFRENQDIFVLK